MPTQDNLFVRSAGASQRHRRGQFSRLNTASEKRRGDLVRDANVAATTHVIQGFREIVGSGENLVDVRFPVVYTQIPFFTFGWSLVPGSELVDGQYPSVTAGVAYWEVNEPDLDLYGAPLRQHYRGAQLAVVTVAPETQRIILNWQFSGMALTNPAGGERAIPTQDEIGRLIS